MRVDAAETVELAIHEIAVEDATRRALLLMQGLDAPPPEEPVARLAYVNELIAASNAAWGLLGASRALAEHLLNRAIAILHEQPEEAREVPMA